MPDAPGTLARWAIIATGGVASLGIIFGSVALAVGFWRNTTETANFLREVLRGGNALRLLAVFMVIFALVILGALDRLSEAVVTLLSSVAAFSLGGLRRDSDNGKPGSPPA